MKSSPKPAHDLLSVIFLAFVPHTLKLFLICRIPVWQKEIIYRSCLWSVRGDRCSCFLSRKQPGRSSTVKSPFSIMCQNYFSCIQNPYSYQFGQYSHHIEAILPGISHWLGRMIRSITHGLLVSRMPNAPRTFSKPPHSANCLLGHLFWRRSITSSSAGSQARGVLFCRWALCSLSRRNSWVFCH